MTSDKTTSGAALVAESLRAIGVDTIFEVPGDPIGGILSEAARTEIHPYTFRHEQAAALAAQAWSYATGKLGVAVVPSGPAMTNAITGLYTAWANTWPMLLIGGNGSQARAGLGDFQETPQVAAAAPFCKLSVAVPSAARIPYYISAAQRAALGGRPGPVYLDLPADVITGEVPLDAIEPLPVATAAPAPIAADADIERAIALLSSAQRPLLLVGKGAAWAGADSELRSLVDRLQLPFLPSPMGKGTIPDDHPLSAAGARSVALQSADCILLVGARLNWIFHFGAPPRFDPDVKVIQVDIEASEIGNAVPAAVGLVGDAKAVARQLLDAAPEAPLPIDAWRRTLQDASQSNAAQVASLIDSDDAPMNFYRMYRDIADVLDDDATVVADGESTQAVSRVMLPNSLPRHRLDAGTGGCMGVAVPYAIGAQIARPTKQVVCLNGDFAFGWNGMEIETAARYQLPIVFIVANNRSIAKGGSYGRYGYGEVPESDDPLRYDQMMDALGGRGEFVADPAQLRPALERAFAERKPTLLNVLIDKDPKRKPQEFSWLDRLGRMRYDNSEQEESR